MEMHRGLLLSMLLVALLSLIRTTSSLPPDFFRNGLVHGSRRSSPPVTRASSWWGASWGSGGRPQSQQHHYGKRGDLLPHKRSSVENELISSACTFCGSFSSNFDFECKQNIGTRRRDCVLAYVEQVESVLSKRGWK